MNQLLSTLFFTVYGPALAGYVEFSLFKDEFFNANSPYSGGSQIAANGSKESDAKNGVFHQFYWMTLALEYTVSVPPVFSPFWKTTPCCLPGFSLSAWFRAGDGEIFFRNE